MYYEFDIALSFATENQELVEKIYYYLRAYGLRVFYAPSAEAQPFLTGRNQSEAFFDVFARKTKYVALLVSKSYVEKVIPMEEANIAFAAYGDSGRVIPIYLDGTKLPKDMWNPAQRNYFESDNPAEIAKHLAAKAGISTAAKQKSMVSGRQVMNVMGNNAEKQVFIQTLNGSIEL